MSLLAKFRLPNFLLAALAAAPLFAQPSSVSESKPAQSTAPTIKVATRIVLIDVVVTDHKGESIPDLHKEDFVIEEDGKQQTLSAFDEHKPNTSAPVEPPVLPPNVYSNQAAVKPSDSVNVLLIDMLNTQPWFQKDVVNQVSKYLESVPPGTRIAIFTFNMQRVRLIRGFTTDFSALSTALDDKNIGAVPESDWLNPTPARQGAELQGFANMMMMQASPAAVNAVSEYLGEENAQHIAGRTELTLQAFQHLARYLSGIPARKNVIWFADTFPVSFVPEEKVHAPRQRENVQRTANLLTAAQVAIYPISARGLVGDPTFEVNDTLGVTRNSVFESLRTTQIAMENVAEQTGGRAFYNTNGLNTAMAKAIEEGSHYYTLAYSPTNSKTDGKYRNIEIKLSNRDYKLSYRRGYYADKPNAAATSEQSAEDPLIPLVGFGMPNFDQITYQIQASPVHPQPAQDASRAGLNTDMKAPFTRFGVDVSVSLQNFTFETTPDGVRHGRIEAIVIAYDRSGKIVNIAKRKSRLALKPADYAELQSKGLPVYLELDVPPGDVYLRTGIYDVGSGNAGTLGFPLTDNSSTHAAAK